jgi:hypothetical protein
MKLSAAAREFHPLAHGIKESVRAVNGTVELEVL